MLEKYYKKKIRKEYKCFDKYRSVRDSYIGHLSYGSCGRLMYKNIKN